MKIKRIIFLGFAAVGWLVLPRLSQAATLYVNPASGSFSVGSVFSVSIRTNTQGAAVNTAETTVNYTTDTLELVRVSAGSSFPLQTPGSPTGSGGRAFFSGGVPTPGYNGSSGIAGTITFRARAEGTARVTISSGKVLLNDGQGTNALSGSSGAVYSIVPPPVGAPTVTSSTHPDQNSWYATTTAEFSWNRPSGAYGFSFELDQNEETIPDNTLDTTVTTEKSYTELKDGVWHFHVKARSQTAAFGNTSHFKVQVDTQKPLLFEVNLVGQNTLSDVSRTPTISFEATDETSGISHYSIYLDGALIAERTVSPYTFNKLETGPHVIRVMAYDKANNDRKAELPVNITGPEAVTEQVTTLFQRNLRLPIYILIVSNLILLILVILLLFLWRRRDKEKDPKDPIAAIQAQIDASLDGLKLHINKELERYAKNTAVSGWQKEQEVSQEVTGSIAKAKRKIDKQIGSLKKKSKES